MRRLPHPAARHTAAPIALATLAALTACTPPTRAPRTRPEAPAFAWPGAYELVGQGFSVGDREARLTVTRADTGYAMTVDGPPGRLEALHIAGDSAHVVWNFDNGESVMRLRLRGIGDSLTGRWQVDDRGGPVAGRRVR